MAERWHDGRRLWLTKSDSCPLRRGLVLIVFVAAPSTRCRWRTADSYAPPVAAKAPRRAPATRLAERQALCVASAGASGKIAKGQRSSE